MTYGGQNTVFDIAKGFFGDEDAKENEALKIEVKSN